jgi:hypothetical protein
VFAPLARAVDGVVALGEDGVVELRLATSALEFAGARVELPPEVSEERDLDFDDARLELAGGSLQLDGVVRYDLKASLGGREISIEELRALAAATQPLVRLGGEWRALNPKALARARAMAASALHSPGMPAMTALGAALAGSTDVRGVVMGVVESDGDLAALATELRDPALRRPVEPTAGFDGLLRPYQKAGLGWLVRMRQLGLGALLADDMGLGKTVQLIAYLLDRRDDDNRPALIVCPTSVLGNWQRELHRFAPELRALIHHGPDRTARAADLEAWDVVLTSYALLPRDRRMLSSTGWRTFVLDEAQAVKNPLTRAAQTARAITAAHRVALTGTPVENRLDDLWSIMHILNPGLRGGCLAADDGAVPAAAAQDRPLRAARLAPAAGLDRVLHAHRRAGRPLPGHDRRDARPRPRPLRDRAPRQRAGADHTSQAGLQPPSARARPPRCAGRTLGQARPGHRDAGRGRGRGG